MIFNYIHFLFVDKYVHVVHCCFVVFSLNKRKEIKTNNKIAADTGVLRNNKQHTEPQKYQQKQKQKKKH
jgi:hypothetical protein